MKATAPGKIILFGEHSVVYGRPALAVPVPQVQATCLIEAGSVGQGLTIVAKDLGWRKSWKQMPFNDPIALATQHLLTVLQITTVPDLTLHISSTIPIARGLGSGAAISVAVIKALSAYFDQPLSTQTISDIAFEVEKVHHGTPSGIDNTVVAFAQPIFFQKTRPIVRLKVGVPLTFVIGDTGVRSPTHKVVGDLRQRWQVDQERYEDYFDDMAAIATQARLAIEHGHKSAIGKYMIENHAILQQIGVSSPLLNRLVDTAIEAGVLGAKLSGAGWGGNMIALTEPEQAATTAEALQAAGAKNTIIAQITPD